MKQEENTLIMQGLIKFFLEANYFEKIIPKWKLPNLSLL